MNLHLVSQCVLYSAKYSAISITVVCYIIWGPITLIKIEGLIQVLVCDKQKFSAQQQRIVFIYGPLIQSHTKDKASSVAKAYVELIHVGKCSCECKIVACKKMLWKTSCMQKCLIWLEFITHIDIWAWYSHTSKGSWHLDKVRCTML